MAFATAKHPFQHIVYSHHHQLETAARLSPELRRLDMEGAVGGKTDQNENDTYKEDLVGNVTEQTDIGVVYTKDAAKHADTVTAYFRRNSRQSTLYPCDDFELFKSSMRNVPSSAVLYVLVDEDLRQLLHERYASYQQVFADITKSVKMLCLVSYLDDEEDFQEVKYKLPKEVRKNIIPRDTFKNITNGFADIPDNDNMVVQIGDDNKLEVHPATGNIKATQIGGHSEFHYNSASVSGYVLTVRTPKGNHKLDVDVKNHIDDNRDHINIDLEELHATVVSTELGSVIIRVEVKEGTKIGPDWLRKLVTRILSEDIISRLPFGTRMEVNIQASLPLNPLDVNIFDFSKEEIAKELLQLTTSPTHMEPGSQLMHHAATVGTGHILQELLSAGADANQPSSLKNTPLHKAALSGNTEIIDLLIQNGANVHAMNSDLDTPLHLAARTGSTACIKRLILADNPSILESDEIKTDTDDHVLENTGLPKTPRGQIAVRLLRAKADFEARDTDENTPLHIAAGTGNTEIVEILIAYGADLKSLNSKKETPLHKALASGNMMCGSKLAAKDTLNMTDVRGNTPLHVVGKQVKYHSYEKQNRLPSNGNSPLHTAVIYEMVDATCALIKLGQDVNSVNKTKQSPLHIVSDAAKNLADILDVTANVTLEQLLAQYLENNGDINAQNKKGNTILHNAVLLEDTKFALHLMKNGADVSKTNYARETVLHALVKSQKGSATLVGVIQKYGGDLNARDSKNNTPLHVATGSRNKPFCFALIKAGADFHIVNQRGISPLRKVECDKHMRDVYECMISKGPHHLSDISSGHKFNEDGNTALHFSALAGDLNGMVCLVKNGSHLDAKNMYGETAFHLLASTYHCRYDFNSEIGLLRKFGYLGCRNALLMENARGETPLKTARRVRNKDAVALFGKMRQHLDLDDGLAIEPGVSVKDRSLSTRWYFKPGMYTRPHLCNEADSAAKMGIFRTRQTMSDQIHPEMSSKLDEDMLPRTQRSDDKPMDEIERIKTANRQHLKTDRGEIFKDKDGTSGFFHVS